MRKNFGPRPAMYPMPVLMIATYNEDGTANVMNAAWGGISEENEISICVDNSHKTAANLLLKKAIHLHVPAHENHLPHFRLL